MSTANAAQRTHWNEVIGPRWVSLGDAMEVRLQEVGQLTLDRAAPAPGESVLEIGSGTGSQAIRLAEAVGPAGRVLGVDISRPMVEAAEARARQAGLANLSFRLADAQTEKLPEATFDLAVSRFGVMFFDDPPAAFANIRGALKPPGRLAFSCWGPLQRNPHWAVPLAVAVRHLGAPEPRPPHAPGPLAFDDPDYVRSVLGSAGWRDIAVEEAAPLVLDATIAEAVQDAVTMGPAAALINEREAPQETIERIRADIAAEFARLAGKDRISLRALVFLVTARTR